MTSRERIYIVGFMGCGKTTAGRKLAAQLNWQFIDLDKEIEHKTGKKIPEIFSEFGEAYFRKIEEEILRETDIFRNAVISTGGGAPCYGNNMDFMISSGITVYLKLTPGQLRDRLIRSKTERPLIKGLGSRELLQFIKDKLKEREKYYSRAEIILEGFDLNIEAALMLINAVLYR